VVSSALLALALLLPQLQSEDVSLRAYDGRGRTVRKARLRLPADHARPSGRTLEIASFILPAKAKAEPPVIFLMGGPGIPGSVLAPIPPYFDLFDRLSESADVVVLDQRGVGESSPKVDCPPPSRPVSAAVFESKANLLAVFRGLNQGCAEHWRKANVEPADFAIEQLADDVEALRVALRAEQVDLLAFSYGTRIAREVLRRHPASVRRAVLQGALARTIRMPHADDRTFRAVAALAHAQSDAKRFDADIESSLRDIQKRLDRAPLEIGVRSLEGQDVRVRVSRETFDAVVATRLGDRRLPAMLTNANRGETTILSQWLEAMFQDLEKGGAPLVRGATVCSAAEEAAVAKAAEREAPRSLLGLPFDNLQQGPLYCQVLGFTKQPGSTAAPRSTTPVLLISGTMDDRTPPAGAEALRAQFARSEHLIVTNGGHELLPEPQVQQAVVAFLRGQPLPTSSIELPPPDFPDVEAAKRPPRRP
jgi:pimeloyl-ACP methyl ester carboxylesterase